MCKTVIIEVMNLRGRGDTEGAGWGRGRSRNDVNIVTIYIYNFQKIKKVKSLLWHSIFTLKSPLFYLVTDSTKPKSSDAGPVTVSKRS